MTPNMNDEFLKRKISAGNLLRLAYWLLNPRTKG